MHDDDISMDDGRKLRCHKGNGVIYREVDMVLEKYSEDLNLMSKYKSDITVMDVRLHVGAIDNAFNNWKVCVTSIHPFCSSCGNFDHSGMKCCRWV